MRSLLALGAVLAIWGVVYFSYRGFIVIWECVL
jgi:hypothetical protein